VFQIIAIAGAGFRKGLSYEKYVEHNYKINTHDFKTQIFIQYFHSYREQKYYIILKDTNINLKLHLTHNIRIQI